jgi:hypothetical protein
VPTSDSSEVRIPESSKPEMRTSDSTGPRMRTSDSSGSSKIPRALSTNFWLLRLRANGYRDSEATGWLTRKLEPDIVYIVIYACMYIYI